MSEAPAIVARAANTTEKPFSWVAKAATRRIRERAGGNTAHCLAVYHALAEIASDKSASTFTTSKTYISKRCGGVPKVRSVETALYELEAIGVIGILRTKIEGKKANEVNTYTLTTMLSKAAPPSRTDDAPPSRTDDAGASRSGRVSSGARKKNNSLLKGERVVKETITDAAASLSPLPLAGEASGSVLKVKDAWSA